MTAAPSPSAPAAGEIENYGALPWRYRPDKYDDWGCIRDANGHVVASVRYHHEDAAGLEAHRAAKTDPAGPLGSLVVLSVNSHPTLLAERDRLREQLLKYGRHTSDCGMHRGRDCDCGWYETRNALGEDTK